MRHPIRQMTAAERDEIDRYFLERWGMTREALMDLTAQEITEVATARGLSVAGITTGGEFNVRGDGKDKRN